MLMTKQNIETIRATGTKLVIVAVCTYKRPKMLDICLHSLVSQTVPIDVILQIAVVDNDQFGSGHQSYTRFAHCYPFWSVYLQEHKRGIASCRNKAIQYAREQEADFLAFIDDDEVAHEDWLMEHMERSGQDILSGQHVMHYPESIPNWAYSEKPKRIGKEGEDYGPGTGNMVLSSRVFNSLSFDETLGLGGGEDMDFLRRARLFGFRRYYVPNAIVYESAHPQRYTFFGTIKRCHWEYAADMRYGIARRGKFKAILKKTPSMVFALPISLMMAIGGLALYPAHNTYGLRMILKAGKIMARALGRLTAIYGHIPQSYTVTVGE